MHTRIQNLMEKRGVTGKVLSEHTGIPQSTVSHWLTQKHLPSVKNLLALSEYFGVPVSYFFGEDNGILYTEEDLQILDAASKLKREQKFALLHFLSSMEK